MIGPLKQTYGVKLKPELDYMTASEQAHFREMVKAGVVTMFRVSRCAICSNDIPRHKVYCSLECKEKHEQQKKQQEGQEDGQNE
jgi:hypothetical protein